MSLAPVVYVLCLITSLLCSYLLVRRYFVQPTRLLLWSAACFVLLSLNNLFLVSDVILFPTIDFAPYRTAASLGAVVTLVYGFIWELD